MTIKAIQIFDTALTFVGEIACYESLRLCRRFGEVGEFELVVPLSHPMAERLVRDRLLCPAGQPEKAMLIESVTRDTGTDTVSASGYTLSGLLRRRICVPEALDGDGFGYDRIVADAESVMRHYVMRNVVAPQSEARRMDCVALEANNLMRGKQAVPWSARFEMLDELLADVSAYCDAGFALVPDFAAGKLVFTYLPGRDRTGADGNARVTFGMHMGNVSATAVTQDARQEKNAAFTGGAGEDEDRLMLFVCPDAETGISRREMFVDAGSVNDPQELAYEGERRLAQQASVHAMRADVRETPSCRYGVHWDLGDRVTVVASGMQMIARITQVQEIHEAGKPVQLDVTFGRPAGGIERVIRARTRHAAR